MFHLLYSAPKIEFISNPSVKVGCYLFEKQHLLFIAGHASQSVLTQMALLKNLRMEEGFKSAVSSNIG